MDIVASALGQPRSWATESLAPLLLVLLVVALVLVAAWWSLRPER